MKSGRIVTLGAAALAVFAFGPPSVSVNSVSFGAAYAAPGGAGGGGRGASTGGTRGTSTTGARTAGPRVAGTGRTNPIRSGIANRAAARAEAARAANAQAYRSGSGRTYRTTSDWTPYPGYPFGYYPYNYNYWLYIHVANSGGASNEGTAGPMVAEQQAPAEQTEIASPLVGYSQVFLGCTPNPAGETWTAYTNRCTALEANAQYVAHVVPGCRPLRDETVGSFSHRCVFGGASRPTTPAAE